MFDRLFDTQTLGLVLLVGLFLAVLYLVATAFKEHRRRIEREQLETLLRQRETVAAPPPSTGESTPLSTSPLTPSSGPPPAPAPLPSPPPPSPIAPPEPTPRPRFLLTWTPPTTDPPRFRQYITWPGTKLITPLVEQAPSDRDYVWQ